MLRNPPLYRVKTERFARVTRQGSKSRVLTGMKTANYFLSFLTKFSMGEDDFKRLLTFYLNAKAPQVDPVATVASVPPSSNVAHFC